RQGRFHPRQTERRLPDVTTLLLRSGGRRVVGRDVCDVPARQQLPHPARIVSPGQTGRWGELAERTVRQHLGFLEEKVLGTTLHPEARAAGPLPLNELHGLGVAGVGDHDAGAGQARDQRRLRRRDLLGLPRPPLRDDPVVAPAGLAQRLLTLPGDRVVLAVAQHQPVEPGGGAEALQEVAGQQRGHAVGLARDHLEVRGAGLPHLGHPGEAVRPDVPGEAEIDQRPAVEVGDLLAQAGGVAHGGAVGVLDHRGGPAGRRRRASGDEVLALRIAGVHEVDVAVDDSGHREQPARVHDLRRRRVEGAESDDPPLPDVDVRGEAPAGGDHGRSVDREIDHAIRTTTLPVARSSRTIARASFALASGTMPEITGRTRPRATRPRAWRRSRRVAYRVPSTVIWPSTSRSVGRGGYSPAWVVYPTTTIRPPGRTSAAEAASEPRCPTVSTTRSAPRPPVAARTCSFAASPAGKASCAPTSRAASSRCAWTSMAKTEAPDARAICTTWSPTPPAPRATAVSPARSAPRPTPA